MAFTDIEGEVFPAVCTYRSGIEVRLLKVEHWHGHSATSQGQNPLCLLFDPSSLPPPLRLDEYDNSVHHADKESDEKWATALTTRGLSSGRHAWDFVVRRCAKAQLAFGICSPPSEGNHTKDMLGMHKHAWAWRVDGTLWAHGAQVSSRYGARHPPHPLSDGDVVTVTLDVRAQTLGFAVNGRDLGLAFGPPGSGAEAEVPVFNGEPFRVYLPAVSLFNHGDRVRVRPAGTLGTLALPWLLDLENTLMTVGSRLCATVTAGPRFSLEEQRFDKWLRSPLFALGLENGAEALSEAGQSDLIQRFITGLPEDRDLLEHWDIGDEVSFLPFLCNDYVCTSHSSHTLPVLPPLLSPTTADGRAGLAGAEGAQEEAARRRHRRIRRLRRRLGDGPRPRPPGWAPGARLRRPHHPPRPPLFVPLPP